MAKRDRLGKGLGALLGEYLGPEGPEEPRVRELPVSAIAPNPFQPRREFSEEELSDLVASLRENGLLQPIMVRPAPDRAGGADFELVAGERRWRAAMRLQWRQIPAIVRDVDDRTLLVLALVENLQRSQLSSLEEAEAYRQLSDEFSLSQQQIAEAVGRNRSTVANTLRLLQLPVAVRRLIGEGALTAGHARAILSAGDERRMLELAHEAAREGWSVRELEAAAKRKRPGRQASGRRPASERDAAEKRLEEELQRALETEVRIRRMRGKGGRIEIPFHDAEDFERIYEALSGHPAADAVS